MAGSVTLYLTSGSAGAGNFSIYHSSADPNNLIAQNVSSASLAAGYCTNEIYDSYVIQSNTVDCENQVVFFVVPPAPQPTAVPPGPTPVPSPLPTLTNGWRFTAGTISFGGFVQNGFHQATLFACPSTFGFGTPASPTTSQTPLPGTDCYSSIIGNSSKGYGFAGVGAASGLGLTMFSTDVGSGTSTFGIISVPTGPTTNPGTGALSGTIVGNNGTSGTWSANYSAQVTYVDNNGNGISVTPESTGILTLNNITLVNGVTYDINV
jgi:hypothetical protein